MVNQALREGKETRRREAWRGVDWRVGQEQSGNVMAVWNKQRTIVNIELSR